MLLRGSTELQQILNLELLRNWHAINCRCIEATCTGGCLTEHEKQKADNRNAKIAPTRMNNVQCKLNFYPFTIAIFPNIRPHAKVCK